MNGQQPPSYYPPPVTDDQRMQAGNYWGTHVMGTPAPPNSHPNNHHAAAYPNHQQPPYVNYNYSAPPSGGKPTTSAVNTVREKFNVWKTKAEKTANNVMLNLKTGESVSGSAWGKVNLTAKALTGGGFESLYKQTFSTFPYEKLKKTFACYLSTTTGPIAGTLYLSDVHVAFCSDRPLTFTDPSGMQSFIPYKVMVPLVKLRTINPIVMTDNTGEKYIQITTTDGQDLWFMGFVNHGKASQHLLNSVPTSASSSFSSVPSQKPFS